MSCWSKSVGARVRVSWRRSESLEGLRVLWEVIVSEVEGVRVRAKIRESWQRLDSLLEGQNVHPRVRVP